MNDSYRSYESQQPQCPDRLEHKQTPTHTPMQRGKRGFGVIRAVELLKDSIERGGKSPADVTLAHMADETFSRRRRIGNERLSLAEGSYRAPSLHFEWNVSKFADLLQRGEIGWQKDPSTGLYTAQFAGTLHKIEESWVHSFCEDAHQVLDPAAAKAPPATDDAILDVAIKKSDRYILTDTTVTPGDRYRTQPVQPAFTYEESLFIDTRSQEYTYARGHSIVRHTLADLVVSKALRQTPDESEPFNVGTMPSPKIFPNPNEAPLEPKI